MSNSGILSIILSLAMLIRKRDTTLGMKNLLDSISWHRLAKFENGESNTIALILGSFSA